MITMKRWKLSAALIFAAAMAGCSGKEAQPSAEIHTEPVTLHLYAASNSVMLVEQIREAVAKKFPHIQLKTTVDGGEVKIENTISAGQVPDLISYSLGGVTKLKDLQLVSDMTPLLQKHGFDLTRLADGVEQNVRSFSDFDGRFILMPYELNNNALFYNKTIFDKFGVAYPKDGMTWEGLLDVARQVTRMDGGVQYKGFRFEETNMVFKNQLGLPYVDPKTWKAAVNTEGWKHWLETMTAFFAIPGNALNGQVSEKDEFVKEQTLAMRTGPNYMSELPAVAAKGGFDWDVVSLPRFKGFENKGSQFNAPYFAIPPTSKYKDQAFQVIDYILSDEMQTMMSRIGRLPIIKSEKAVSEFGAGVEGLRGKNVQAFFKDTIDSPVPATQYDTIVKTSLVRKGTRGIAVDRKDVNTALREIEEEVNKQIEAEKAK
ncbi:extracellular solute-binding protein [Paenibacillus hemerocallicola]|uniref:Extracellular solute-binding protein n=1 Tax=Paenibacillus hemerocallicola TaxID=1172614 RepID=A0A5C4T2K1_9BACL|nr:extracellular solute-binding protein [Paenibacillus hemerocallicola]TNJ62507.1 extracellular solute-binding protein [Paenibacillus hemerocallicola]